MPGSGSWVGWADRVEVAGSDLATRPVRRGSRPRRPRRSVERLGWRVLALVLAVIEVFGLGWALRGQALEVHQVSVVGISHLTHDQVVAAAHLSGSRSILAIDGGGIRRDLERMAWVRTASVQPLLPDRVAIAIEEWAPVAVYRNGPAGALSFLNDQGSVLAAAEASGGLPVIQGAGSSEPKPGAHPIEAQLLAALVRIQAAFPVIYGQAVASFQLDCVGSLSLTTEKGVNVYFGRVLTPEQFASLSAKLSALKSIAVADPDVKNADKVQYINLEDTQQPAVKFKADKAPPSPSPAASSASPRATPSPIAPVLVPAPCR